MNSMQLTDAASLYNERIQGSHSAYGKYINPTFAKVLKLIGFAKQFMKAEDCYLIGPNGEKYLDLVAGFGACSIGHNNASVRLALQGVLQSTLPTMVQLDCPPLSTVLAERLLAKIPWAEMVYFGSTGSEAVESALKFARCSTRRSKLVYASSAFHGLSLGALSVCGDDQWKSGFGSLLPDTRQVTFNSTGELERALQNRDVAAFIVEPIQAEAGVVLPSPEYLSQAKQLCQHNGTLLIFDEVQTGIGRTGAFLACNHWGVTPDIVCLSKSLSGGQVPVSAVLTTRRVLTSVFSSLDRCVVHSSTFGENNLAMAAGIATLDYLESANLVENAVAMGEYIVSRLEKLKQKHDMIKSIRGKGLLVGLELGKPTSFLLKQVWTLGHLIHDGLFAQSVTLPLMAEHRIMIQVTGHNLNVLKISPPLTITPPDIDYFVEALDSVLTSLSSGVKPLVDLASIFVRGANPT